MMEVKKLRETSKEGRKEEIEEMRDSLVGLN